MSATTSTASTKSLLPEGAPERFRTSGLARTAVWAVIGLDTLILVVGGLRTTPAGLDQVPDVAFWAVAVAVVGLAAIQTTAGPQLGMDMPVLLAAGFVLGPLAAGLIAFVGYVDLREFRGQVKIERALFNRSQISLAVMAASSVFLLVGGSDRAWPGSVPAALVAIAVDIAVNFAMIAGVMSLHERVRPRVSLRRLRLGSVSSFAMSYLCFGLLSVLLTVVYADASYWGLVLFAMPLVLARHALSSTQRLDGAKRRLKVQSEALRRASDQVVDERRDERLTLAAGLHDDVLPPLFKVHLLGQVLRQELATGQLLALEDDLPLLLRATDEASQTVREQIRSLRASTLGAHGLARALDVLVDHMNLEQGVEFSADAEDLRATPIVELLAYQIIRELVRNAARHANADHVHISVASRAQTLILTVEDDGIGFVPESVDEAEHFGIALMRERVELAGGAVDIDSRLRSGTRVIVRLPLVDPIQP